VLSSVPAPPASAPSVPSPLPPKLYTSLTRARFEELCQDLFHSTLEPVEKVLRDSKIDKANVHEIDLVGGSTRTASASPRLGWIRTLTEKITGTICTAVSY
jgi:molecular chaperone DnaK (HSP70)